MARPRVDAGEETVNVSLRLPQSLVAQLRENATAAGVLFSEMCRRRLTSNPCTTSARYVVTIEFESDASEDEIGAVAAAAYVQVEDAEDIKVQNPSLRWTREEI